MIDITGDLWTYPADATGITTNGFVKLNGACVMGRGCAQQARDRYPGLDRALGDLITKYGNRCFRIVIHPTRTLLTFPVKPMNGPQGEPGFAANADLNIIARSCEQAMAMADKFAWERIVLPRPGSGNGRLKYERDVRPVIAPLLDDRFLVITFG